MIYNKTYFGDCLELLDNIPEKSVDLILCDLPFGLTKNKWDTPINLEALWGHYKRIAKKNTAIILFGKGRFTAKVIMSNLKWYRYNLVWEKTTPTGHLNAKKMPLASHEDIMVFYQKQPTYNPQKTTGHVRKVSTAHHKRNSVKTTNYGKHGLTSYDSTERYPKSVLKFPTDRQKSKLHSTQKPLKLIEYLIMTFSNEGDLVLDNCAGSGTTGLAAKNLNRNYIMMENDVESYNKCLKRLDEN